MHLPDGFLDPKFSGGLLGAAAAIVGYCVAKVMRLVTAVVPRRVLAAAGNRLGDLKLAGQRVLAHGGEARVLRMGQVALWVFAAQMFNFPVAQGTSGHLLGGVFAAVVLGPFAGVVTLSVVLLVQAIVFADGGVLALGANIVNMAVIGTGLSYYIYMGLKRVCPEWLAIAVTAWASVTLASLACALEIGLSGTSSLTPVAWAMFKVHAVIGMAEAGLTLLLLRLFPKEPQA